MNGLPPQEWLNALLVLLQGAQLALLRLWHALGLTGESHGQPAWPWARRIAGETLLIDLGLARQLTWSVCAIAFALVAVFIALAWRSRRVSWLAAALAALVLAPWPSSAVLLVPAMPTSFHESPTHFSVDAIAHGERIYTRHCVACHGTDGRGEGPLAPTLTRWPPTIVSPLLARRADGEMFWHLLHGMRDAAGAQTMPAFGGRLNDEDAWAVLDYLKTLAAGSGAIVYGSWPVPLRLPDVAVRCGAEALRLLSTWRGNQRVRVVAFDGRPPLPLEDPRFLTLLVTPDGNGPASVPRFRAGCVAASPAAWGVFARIAGASPERFAGAELLVDRSGWLRARGGSGRGAWSDADLLCTSGQAEQGRRASVSAPDGLTALLLRMEAEPVRFVKGGFVH